MSYATQNDLSSYLGSVPESADRLLTRASELLDALTLGRIDLNNAEHSEAVKNATCAQVEYWLQIGEDMEIMGNPDNFRMDNFIFSAKLPQLAPRAKRYLFLAGLLYRGV